MQLLEKGQNFLSGAGIQGAGGLICQNDRGLRGQRPGNRHPLLLAARELVWHVVHPFLQAHPLERLHDPLPALPLGHRGVDERQLHVFVDVELCNEVVLLKDKAQHFAQMCIRDRHKEVLYFLSLRLYSTTQLAAVRGQSDRNIRKLRKTIHKKLQRQMYDHLCRKQEHGGSLTLRERQFLEEYSKIARKQGKDAVIRRENKTKRRKKKNRP